MVDYQDTLQVYEWDMTKINIKITYCCMDCGSLICSITALYGKGRCCVCANLGINNPMFGISRFNIENGNFKGLHPGPKSNKLFAEKLFKFYEEKIANKSNH